MKKFPLILCTRVTNVKILVDQECVQKYLVKGKEIYLVKGSKPVTL